MPKKRSRCLSVIVIQQTAESFVTDDVSGRTSDFIARLNDLVPQPLMISFAVVMRKEFGAGDVATTSHRRRSFLSRHSDFRLK